EFFTYSALAVVGSRCEGWRDRCAPLDPFMISFSNPIDKKKFDKGMISVAPELPGMKVVVAGANLMITGRSRGRTHYKVTSARSLADEHGQTLGHAPPVSFDVGSAEPTLFGAEEPMVVLDPAAPKAYAVHTINEPGLRTRVYAVTPDDWAKYV